MVLEFLFLKKNNLIMSIKYILLSIVLIYNLSVLGQKYYSINALLKDDTINKVDCFMVGENHQNNNALIKFEMINELYENLNVKVFFLELPIHLQLYIEYFFSDKKENLSQIKDFKKLQNNKDIILLLNLIKKKYKAQLIRNDIKFICIDVTWFESVSSVKTFFSSFEKSRVNEILNNFKEEKPNVNLFKDLQKEIEINKNSYINIYSNYYKLIMKLIQNNIEYYRINNPTIDFDYNEYREESLYQNIADYQVSKIAIFTGSDHLCNGDSTFFSNLDPRFIPSLYDRINEKTSFKTIRLSIVFIPRKFYHGLWVYDVTKYIPKKIFRKNNKNLNYLIVNSNLYQSIGNKYQDYLIIVNRKKYN